MINTKQGVTALEILIVVSILAFLLAAIVPSFLDFRRNSALNTGTQEIITVINKARLSTISSKGDMQYGVHFEATQVVLFQGTIYSALASTNEVHILDSTLTLMSIVVNGGGSEVVFQKITGETTQNATTTLSVLGTIASTTLVIRPSGVVTIY